MAKVDVGAHGDVVVIRLSNPPVNALAHGVRTGLIAAVRSANADPAVKAIVVTGEGRACCLGWAARAVIQMFSKPHHIGAKKSPDWQNRSGLESTQGG